jgi:xanthine dehydrogenase accessory factor
MKNVYLMIPEKKSGKEPLSIATVIKTMGSTPQKHGSSALFAMENLIAGTVGGGILEAKVQKLAQDYMVSKKSGVCSFSLDNDIAYKNDAICGGHVTVLIDGSPGDHNAVFEQIRDSIQDRIPGILVTIVSGKTESNKYIRRYWVTSENREKLPDQFSFLSLEEIEKLLTASPTGGFVLHEMPLNAEGESSFALLEPISPSPRLIIAGAGHIGKALSHLGKLLDFEVTVIDSRKEFANKINLPDADNIIVEDMGEAITNLKNFNDSYIIIVTRGHDDDAKVLRASINTSAIYIGMIGSKNKIAKMHRSFIENGWVTEKQWSDIHAPIGIDINSKTVEEIAVSIAAQLILFRNSK